MTDKLSAMEVGGKAAWNMHRRLYPADTIIRGEWRADEDNGFLHNRFAKYAEAAILAYLSALPKDGTVEAVARALCVSMGIDPDAETMMTMADPNGGCRELGECSEWETMVDQARAVLRTLATRAQGESS